ncbi:MAG TPA: hypothetical protein PLW88_06680 [Syntrophorhabdaceae bacterium]|nr:hypothetical protein [Syntrophorhabdaceae bacterium]
MREKRFILILFSIAIFFTAFSCGKKADPIPRGSAVPEDVVDLKAEVKDGVLFLSFTVPLRNKDGSEARNLKGFKIYKGCGGCIGAFEPIKDIRLDAGYGFTIYGGRLYTFDDDLVEGNIYSYKVIPYTDTFRCNESNIVTIKWESTPDKPKIIKVEESDRAIEITWQGQPGLLYNVYRRIENEYPLFPVNERPLITSKFQDTQLENDRTYIYEVRAVREKDGILWEGMGERIKATPKDKTPPGIPYGLKAVKEENTIRLTWIEVSDTDLAGYNVYRVDGEKKERLTAMPIKDNYFVDTKLPGVRYISYYVTSVDLKGNESEPSQEQIIILRE